MKEKRVHVIFKTHLDIGFTDLAEKVVDNYLNGYIPAAMELARKSRLAEGSPNRFIWTTGSWLINEYLEVSDSRKRKLMEEAIEQGDICWHALPFTTHSELMDKSLFREGLRISERLDRRFGKKTVAAKMTDVPGHTRAIIPLLAEAGVEFLHIGVNPASSTLDVPPLFRWQSPEGEEVVVNYVSGYGQPLEVEGLEDYLVFAHTGDNCGPPSESDLAVEFDKLRQIYPDAAIKGSTLDEFACAVRSVRASLPVVTGDMGDTWIHGTGTDPLKVARFRALSRLRKSWELSGRLEQDPGIDNFTNKLLLIPEHTWGMDEKTHLKDYRNYSKTDFVNAREADLVPEDVVDEGEQLFSAFKMDSEDTSSEREHSEPPSYRRFESSWKEQRKYINDAVACLKNSDFRKEAEAALDEIVPEETTEERLLQDGFTHFDPEKLIKTKWFELSFSGDNGAMTNLVDRQSGKVWCTQDQPFSRFRYQVFSAESYKRFYEKYNINKDWTAGWSIPDFTKPGLDKVDSLEERFYDPLKADLFLSEKEDIVEVVALVRMDKEPVILYGAPERVQIRYTFGSKKEIGMELQWFGKVASRIPEAMWFSFNPAVSEQAEWSLDKMGCSISPFEVIGRGNRALHCTGEGVFCREGEAFLQLEPVDSALVSPGRPRVLEYDQNQPDVSEGIHFNLYNNFWGTNFPMWYGDDGKARFRLRFQAL